MANFISDLPASGSNVFASVMAEDEVVDFVIFMEDLEKSWGRLRKSASLSAHDSAANVIDQDIFAAAQECPQKKPNPSDDIRLQTFRGRLFKIPHRKL